jgi:hypothetical protein
MERNQERERERKMMMWRDHSDKMKFLKKGLNLIKNAIQHLTAKVINLARFKNHAQPKRVAHKLL